MTTDVDVDVVIVGDGPAGTALANACTALGIRTLLVGEGKPWTNSYGTWLDDLTDCRIFSDLDVDIESLLATRCDEIRVHTDRPHIVARPYGLLDNVALRRVLSHEVDRLVSAVVDVDAVTHDRVVVTTTTDTQKVASCLVVDATGWPPRFANEMLPGPDSAWQTAFGVVLARPPVGDLGRPTLMDFGRVDDDPLVTFAYSLPVSDGWLVEETVLAARPAVDPDRLRERLALRLESDVASLSDRAIRTETVRIPMGGPQPSRAQPIAAYGAAAGGIHPISGYSIVASLGRAPQVAAAIRQSLADRVRQPADHAAAVWEVVWPTSARRSRVLHDYGLEMLLGLDGDAARAFFGTFFDLPASDWAAFMRSGTSARQLAGTMTHIFRTADRSVKRRLIGGNPSGLSRLLRPR